MHKVIQQQKNLTTEGPAAAAASVTAKDEPSGPAGAVSGVVETSDSKSSASGESTGAKSRSRGHSRKSGKTLGSSTSHFSMGLPSLLTSSKSVKLPSKSKQ